MGSGEHLSVYLSVLLLQRPRGQHLWVTSASPSPPPALWTLIFPILSSFSKILERILGFCFLFGNARGGEDDASPAESLVAGLPLPLSLSHVH